VTDLVAITSGVSSVTVSFTEVDDGTGAPATYQLRQATPTMDWSGATVVSQGTCAGSLDGIAIGETRTCTAGGLATATSYEFQMIAYRGDIASDTVVLGAVSNVASATTEESQEPTPPPPPTGVLFRSDWSTALGSSDAAIRDTNQQIPWSAAQSHGAQVISSAGLGFPTANVLDARVLMSGSFARANVIRYDGLGVLPVGTRRYYRFYIRVMTPDSYDALSGADSHTHPIQDGNAASTSNWMFQVFTDPDGTWQMRLAFSSGSANTAPNHYFTAGSFPKRETYRVELEYHRISSAQYNMHARVYDSSGALVADDDDWRNADGSATFASNPALNFNSPSYSNGLNSGHNGVYSAVGADQYPFTLYHLGGFAVCGGSWCGPYNGGT
jgi:hypothetical protein